MFIMLFSLYGVLSNMMPIMILFMFVVIPTVTIADYVQSENTLLTDSMNNN